MRWTFASLSIIMPLLTVPPFAWGADQPSSPDQPPLEPPAVRLGSGSEDGPDLTLPNVTVVSQRLDAARSQIQPGLGATKYDFSLKEGADNTDVQN